MRSSVRTHCLNQSIETSYYFRLERVRMPLTIWVFPSWQCLFPFWGNGSAGTASSEVGSSRQFLTKDLHWFLPWASSLVKLQSSRSFVTHRAHVFQLWRGPLCPETCMLWFCLFPQRTAWHDHTIWDGTHAPQVIFHSTSPLLHVALALLLFPEISIVLSVNLIRELHDMSKPPEAMLTPKDLEVTQRHQRPYVAN